MQSEKKIKPIRVALDRSVSPWASEVKYVFKTLLRIAGYPYEFGWTGNGSVFGDADIYYGPPKNTPTESVSIIACGRHYNGAPWFSPKSVHEVEGISYIDFGMGGKARGHSKQGQLTFFSDIVFASYWLLIGAQESSLNRDRWDNLSLEGTLFLKEQLNKKPMVSIYGNLLREHFSAQGRTPLDLPWISGSYNASFSFSHDVDYPEMIRWIECLRLVRARGLKAIDSIRGVLAGTNHFWKFGDWVEFSDAVGTSSTFYFMARQGSLFQYARGTPDAFYDIRAAKFKQLFSYLQEQDCEIGLHASYHSHRNEEQLRCEKELLESVAGVSVQGNRHHYWHLDPLAPHETLRKHERIGLTYDSSLAFEFYPGFRRGICHPFKIYHPGERRELDLVELPPTWMDDHFDHRLSVNNIKDPSAYARELVEVAKATGGTIIVDYHARGMNTDFFPRYGRWLKGFVENHLDSTISFNTPRRIAQLFNDYERKLAADSDDLTQSDAFHYLESGIMPKPRTDEALSVDFLQSSEETLWDQFVESHPRATIYHSIAWKSVTEDGLGHKPYYLRVFDRSGNIAGALPLFLVTGIFGRRMVSVPMRDRAGALVSDQGALDLLITRAIDLSKELKCQYLLLKSELEPPNEVLQNHNLCCEHNWTTTRIDLNPGVDQLWKNLDKRAIRWAINNVRKQGVRVEIDNTMGGIELFYKLFVKTRTSMGIPPFSKKFFIAIWQHLISKGKANLWIVWNGTVPINSMINFLSGDTFLPAYAAPQREWAKLYPSEFMIWHTIEWACSQEFRCYDFGADSSRQIGLLWFKKKWGGVAHSISFCYHLNDGALMPDSDSSSSKYELLRSGWSKLPLSMSRFAGGWLTRQLS